MALKEIFETLWTDSLNEKAEEVASGEMLLAALVGASGACIIGLAAEIDRLRDELVAKGLLESA